MTYFGLMGSLIGTILMSSLINNGKLKILHILKGSLSGGIMISSFSDFLIQGYLSYLIGFCSGLIITFLIEFLPEYMEKIGLYDVRGGFILHGFSGIGSGLLSAIFRRNDLDGKGSIQIAGTFISIGIGLLFGLMVGLIINKI